MIDPILAVEKLTVRFDLSANPLLRILTRRAKRSLHAVEEVSFEIAKGTTFALVGESGCGKSTIARAIAGIQRPNSGSVNFMGIDIAKLQNSKTAMPYRRDLQMIFQDPYSSLNPRWRVGRIIAEPIVTHRLLPTRRSIEARVLALLDQVGLSADDVSRYPHQFSGGQRQRISIARAIASSPALLVCDEPTSALDVSVQAQILNLMRALQRELHLTYLIISHNLAVVAHMADTIGVMYLGRIVEQGDATQIISSPLHPYTRLLIETVPDLDHPGAQRDVLSGEVPSPMDPPSGCSFHPRCPYAERRCKVERPAAREHMNVWVSCHAVEEGRLPVVEQAG